MKKNDDEDEETEETVLEGIDPIDPIKVSGMLIKSSLVLCPFTMRVAFDGSCEPQVAHDNFDFCRLFNPNTIRYHQKNIDSIVVRTIMTAITTREVREGEEVGLVRRGERSDW